jgi:hypothetical protein
MPPVAIMPKRIEIEIAENAAAAILNLGGE